MQPYRSVVLLGIAGLVALAACSPQASPAATTQPSVSAVAAASADPAPAETTATTEPVPSDELGDFTCDLPIVEQATVARAQIVDVRVGAHDGYDRVVFEFMGGTPEFELNRATPPFTQDATGEPITVLGDSFLRLTMRGGTKQMEDGTSSYDGPRDFHPHFTSLQQLVEGGDFEAQSTWYLGLASESCVRVMLLEDEPRLVIDIEH